MEVIEKLESIITPIVQSYGAFLIDISYRGDRGGKVLEIFIDNKDGITTQLCADISNEVSKILDNENILKGDYNLNISSPGLSRPLKFADQYYKHIGHPIEIKYKDENGLSVSKVGTLKDVNTDFIIIKTGDEIDFTIEFKKIIQAIVKTPW